MALLSDREGFDRAAMQRVEEDFLKEIMKSAVEAPGALVVTETCWEKLDLAKAAAKRYLKSDNKYTRQNAQRAVWAIERKMATL